MTYLFSSYSKVFGRVSKFKHLKGDVILKGRFENLKNLSKTMPAECNFVHGKKSSNHFYWDDIA